MTAEEDYLMEEKKIGYLLLCLTIASIQTLDRLKATDQIVAWEAFYNYRMIGSF